MITFLVFLNIILVHIFFCKVPAIHKRHNLGSSALNIRVINIFFSIVVPIFIISLIIGLRYNVGVDYLSYKEIYETKISSDLRWSIDNRETELLFTIICVLLHWFNVPYYGMFVLMAVIPICFFYASFRDEKYLFIPAFICLCLSGVLFMYLNIMRQGISFFIILYSIRYIRSKSFLKYAFWILLASGFHVSALIFLPLYILGYLHALYNRVFVIILYSASLLFSEYLMNSLLLFINPILQNSYIQYVNVIENWNMAEGTGLGVILQHVSDILLITLSPCCFRYFGKERFDIYYNIFLLGVIISNIAGMNLLLNRIPFCLVSMRMMVMSFIFYYCYKFWMKVPLVYKLSAVACLACNIVYFIGNSLSLEYSFIHL